MNKRIRELAEQAGCGAFVDEYAPFKKDFEKFSELLIEECARVDSKENNPDHLDGVTYNQTILRHFGIDR